MTLNTEWDSNGNIVRQWHDDEPLEPPGPDPIAELRATIVAAVDPHPRCPGCDAIRAALTNGPPE